MSAIINNRPTIPATKSVRASRMPLAMLCPASIEDDGIPRTSDSPEARMGSAVHEVMAQTIKENWRLDDTEMANKWTIEAYELQKQSHRALALWDRESEWFGDNPEVEVKMSREGGGLMFTGTADVMYYDEARKTVFVYDHKTGWDDADFADQGKAYCFLALGLYPEAEFAHMIFGRVREFATDHVTYTNAELLEWAARVVIRLVHEGGFNAGPHCSNCNRKWNCPEYRSYVGSSMAILAHAMNDSITDKPADLYDAVKVIERFTEHARSALRLYVEDRGGRLSLGNGFDLVLKEQERSEILFGPGRDVLLAKIGPVALAQCVKVKKTELESIVKENAPRGAKGAAVIDLMRDLDAVGAVDTHRIKMMCKERSAVALEK